MRWAVWGVLLLTACGSEPQPSSEPIEEPAQVEDEGALPTVTEDWTTLFGANAAVRMRVDSLVKFDQELGGIFDRSAWGLEAEGREVPADEPFGLGLYPGGSDGRAFEVQWVLPGPAGHRAVGRFLPQAEAATELPAGTLGGEADLPRTLKAAAAALLSGSPVPPDTLLEPLRAWKAGRWTVEQKDVRILLDARIDLDPSAPEEEGDSQRSATRLLGCLPRDAMVTFYLGLDQRKLARELEPFLRSAGALPEDADLTSIAGLGAHYDGGVAAAYDWTDRGLEFVVVADCSDPSGFLGDFRKVMESQLPIRLPVREQKLVDGWMVTEHRGGFHLTIADEPPPDGGAGYNTFRAAEASPEDVELDAALLQTVVRRTADIHHDSRNIFVSVDAFQDSREVLKRIVLLTEGLRHIELRRTVPHKDPNYASVRAQLNPNGPPRQELPSSSRFPDGLAWLKSAKGNWVLVRLDDPGLHCSDFAWAYPSFARTGKSGANGYRDFSFRLNPEAVKRWWKARRDSGIALIFDGSVVGVLPRAEGECTALGDFLDLPAPIADVLGSIFAGPRLRQTYEYVGLRSEEFVRGEAIEAELEAVLAPKGVRFTIAMYAERVLVVLSADDALVRDAVRALREGTAPTRRVQETLDRLGGEAELFFQADVGAILGQVEIVTRSKLWKMEPEAIDELQKELRAMGSAAVAARREDSTIRVLAEIDCGINEWRRRQRDDKKQALARNRLSSLSRMARDWQELHKSPELPQPEEIEPRMAVDPWGTPCRLRTKGEAIVAESAGPDRKFDTGDDLREGE